MELLNGSIHNSQHGQQSYAAKSEMAIRELSQSKMVIIIIMAQCRNWNLFAWISSRLLGYTRPLGTSKPPSDGKI